MLDTSFTTLEEGIEKLKRAIGIRNQMGGALYWGACEEDCLSLANKLLIAGADKETVASIGGWEKDYES